MLEGVAVEGLWGIVPVVTSLFNEIFWEIAEFALESLRRVQDITVLLILLAGVGMVSLQAWVAQRFRNKELEHDPSTVFRPLHTELRHTLLFTLWYPFGALIRRLKRGKAEADAASTDESPVLSPSIGPSFLLAGLYVFLLFLFSLVLSPLIAFAMGSSTPASAWQVLFFGQRPELAWLLPLERHPNLHLILNAGTWIFIWWWIARLVRLMSWDRLKGNLYAVKGNRTVLPEWRDNAGVADLVEAAGTYKRWARVVPIAGLAFLGLGWLSLDGALPMSPSLWVITLVMILGWVLNLHLKGLIRQPIADQEQVEPPRPDVGNGWPQVEEDLRTRLYLDKLVPVRAPRRVEPLTLEADQRKGVQQLRADGLVSVLIDELLPSGGTLTAMQVEVLSELSRTAYVHTEAPKDRDSLALTSQSKSGAENTSSMRKRHQIVWAPEGTGKSTLVRLAAINHSLVHTRGALVVVNGEPEARAMTEAFREILETSTIRWNVRVRQAGPDLAGDLIEGIVPDVVICSVEQLTVNILANAKLHEPLLRHVGLVIVDDVESFYGPVEVHAQLSFRRLALRLREMSHATDLGDEYGPIYLSLGAISMHEPGTWVETLLNIDAVNRSYGIGESAIREESDAAAEPQQQVGAVEGDDSSAAEGDNAPPYPPFRHHCFYRMEDFHTTTGRSLLLRDVIDSCEAKEVPWHFRACGDEQRHLGRAPLALLEEPRNHVASPLDACAVLLKGRWSAVQREMKRLRRAGSHFNRIRSTDTPEPGNEPLNGTAGPDLDEHEPIAFVLLIDPDQDMAFTDHDQDASLPQLLKTLPIPLHRQPTGAARDSHLGTDLSSRWTEVADLLEVFGNGSADTLRTLADKKALLTRVQTDVTPLKLEHSNKLLVRIPSKMVGKKGSHSSTAVLPPRVEQVANISTHLVSVRDRTSLTVLKQVDEQGAHHAYYPGRIFEMAQGRFVVVGRVSAQALVDGTADSSMSEGDILVDPFTFDDVSSARRRVWIRHPLGGGRRSAQRAWKLAQEKTDEGQTTREQVVKGQPASLPVVNPFAPVGPQVGPDTVLLGQQPIEVSYGAVELGQQHVATYRLGPVVGGLRQRRLFSDEMDTAQKFLCTKALRIHPNPAPPASVDGKGKGNQDRTLRFGEARILAAVMRMVLPVIYRGAADMLGVALHVEPTASNAGPGGDQALPTITSDQPLGPDDALVIYDLAEGGIGAAQNLHSTGVLLLLRVCRLTLERVLYHQRLRAFHDLWGDRAEILAGEDPVSELAHAAEGDPEAHDAAVREQDAGMRRRVLDWLDSRLPPEGTAAARAGVGHYGSGSEEGEGDYFDLGRCWFSEDGFVRNLVWSKHRWQTLDDNEAALDFGFDRKTAEQARLFFDDSDLSGWRLRSQREALQSSQFRRATGQTWGTPVPVWRLDQQTGMAISPDVEPEPTVPQDPGERARDERGQFQADDPDTPDRDEAWEGDAAQVGDSPGLLHELTVRLNALAAYTWPAMEQLASVLKTRCGSTDDHELIRYISAFVQAIPEAPPVDTQQVESPVRVLLECQGTPISKALLMALLLRRCGIDAGVFVNREDSQALCGAGYVGMAPAEHGGPPVKIGGWKPVMWAQYPAKFSGEAGDDRVYAPLDTQQRLEPGASKVEHSAAFFFVPLSGAWVSVKEEVLSEVVAGSGADSEAVAPAGSSDSPSASDEETP